MNGWERENNSSVTEKEEDCAQYMRCTIEWFDEFSFKQIEILNSVKSSLCWEQIFMQL